LIESVWFWRSRAANVHQDFWREIHHHRIKDSTVTVLEQLQLKLDQLQTTFNHIEIINKNNVDSGEASRVTISTLVMALNSPYTRRPQKYI